MKILFMGTPDFAKVSLEYLYNDNYEIAGVVTQPDKPVGRKMILTPPPVKAYAAEKNIPVYQPDSLKTEDFFSFLQEISPDIIIVVAYGKIMPANVLQFPRDGCINVHGSLLPEYRGASPINAAIMAGERVTGITTMYMDEGIDTGDMIDTAEISIGENETFGELHDRLAILGAELLLKSLKDIENGIINRIKQPSENISVTKKITNDTCKIDWSRTSVQIHNQIRAFSPVPTAFTYANGRKLKIYKSLYSDKKNIDAAIGQIIIEDKKLYVRTGDGILEITELQPEGGNKLASREFLNGRKLPEGTILT